MIMAPFMPRKVENDFPHKKKRFLTFGSHLRCIYVNWQLFASTRIQTVTL